METFILRIVVTPSLTGLASLAGRRWGPLVSGWLVGLPFTSAPVALFLALGHGTAFAATVALGTLAGAISQVCFCLAYAGVAHLTCSPPDSGLAADLPPPARTGELPREQSTFPPRRGEEPGKRSWPLALGAACVAFACATLVLRGLYLPAVALFLLTCAVLLGGLLLLPRVSAHRGDLSMHAWPWWDLPLRMALATSVVLLLTAAASALGPRLTGLLAPFPLYAMVLAVFAHYGRGPAAAITVLRGLLLGLFAFASFFLVLALLLVPAGIAATFALACVAALLVQGATLWGSRVMAR